MMVCRFTVLIALLAQGLALMSPACFVRCLEPNGHECVELAGQDCHCNEPRLNDHATGTCCSEHQDADDHDHHEALLSTRHDCGCSHLPLDFGPQSLPKSQIAKQLSDAHAIWLTPLPVTSENVAITEYSVMSPWLLRRQVSPHLAVLATIVLRV